MLPNCSQFSYFYECSTDGQLVSAIKLHIVQNYTNISMHYTAIFIDKDIVYMFTDPYVITFQLYSDIVIFQSTFY